MQRNIVNNKNILIFIVFIMFMKVTNAQDYDFTRSYGILGKKNHVSIDLLNVIRKGEYGINYQYLIKKHIGLSAGFSYLNKNGKTENKIPELIYTIPEGLIEYSYKGSHFSVGIIASSYLNNLPSPIGFYYGYRYDRYSLECTEDFMATNHENSINYDQNINMISFVFGRNGSINEYLSIGYEFDVGFMWGKAKLNNGDHKPKRIYPHNPLHFDYYELIGEFDEGSRSLKGFMFLPRINIGYFF